MISRNILFFVSSLEVGGAELHVLNLCGYLAGHGMNATVCSLKHDEALKARFDNLGIPVHELPIGSLSDLAKPPVRMRIREILAAADPDILHAHMYHAEIVAAAASSMSGVPLVVTRHSSGLEFNGLRRIVAAIAGRKTKRVITVSEEAAKEALKIGAARDSIVTIPNGVDTSRFRPLESDLRGSEREGFIREQFPADCDPGCFLIGSVSGLKPVKNLSMLIEAFAAFESSPAVVNEGARLIIVGEGPSREELERLVEGLGLERKVSFPGYSDRPEEYLPLFDTFILPSRSEGVPIALLEAMSCGLACAASRVGGMPDLLGDCGITFDSGDTEALIEVLGRLAADSVLRSDLGRRARIRAMEYFDLEIWGTRTIEVYEELIDPAGHHSF
jgi:glycosyltransferase involved in cell wall biosynthesis